MHSFWWYCLWKLIPTVNFSAGSVQWTVWLEMSLQFKVLMQKKMYRTNEVLCSHAHNSCFVLKMHPISCLHLTWHECFYYLNCSLLFLPFFTFLLWSSRTFSLLIIAWLSLIVSGGCIYKHIIIVGCLLFDKSTPFFFLHLAKRPHERLHDLIGCTTE